MLFRKTYWDNVKDFNGIGVDFAQNCSLYSELIPEIYIEYLQGNNWIDEDLFAEVPKVNRFFDH